ncbi:voltage-dependent T-type calcium channel subunit alpha-1G isoform X1, partial [Tachysurus ichikawai]
LGVELFGDLICDDLHPCEGLGRYATFKNFGMAFLLLFRVSTGDNWNGIMKDTLRDCAHDTGTCYNTVVSPIYFVSFVLTAQFVLVNVVIAVLMKHLEESNKEAKEEAELEAEMELEAVGGDGGMTGGHISPLALRDIGGPAGSRWISRDSQDRGYPPSSPSAAIRRDSSAHKTDQPQGLEPLLQAHAKSQCRAETLHIKAT